MTYTQDRQAAEYATRAGAELWDHAGHDVTPTDRDEKLEALTWDAAYLLSVCGAALSAIRGRSDPTAITGGIERIVRTLQAQCARAERVAA